MPGRAGRVNIYGTLSSFLGSEFADVSTEPVELRLTVAFRFLFRKRGTVFVGFYQRLIGMAFAYPCVMSG
jgi:hypothetical protein